MLKLWQRQDSLSHGRVVWHTQTRDRIPSSNSREAFAAAVNSCAVGTSRNVGEHSWVLVKELGVRLLSNQVDDLRLGGADIKTLEDQ